MPRGRTPPVTAANESRVRRSFAPALTLLAICVLINYVDRGNLSIAAPVLTKELDISPKELGILLGAFFWSYTAMQFVSGWLVDRFEVAYVIAAGYFLWTFSTAVTGIVHGFVMLLGVRLLLGIGESVAFPSCSKILANNLPEQERGFANGLLMAGIRLGPAIGMFVAGPAIAKYGWRPVFIVIGLIGLLWLPAWFRWMPEPQHQASIRYSGPGTLAILRQRSFWGAALGHISVNYLFYFMLTWLPYYLVNSRGLSMHDMVKLAGIYYLTDAASAGVTGWVADFWMRRGGSATLVRKAIMGGGNAIAIVATAGCALAGPHTYFAWLLAAGVGCGMMGVGVFAYAQTLAGPLAAGKWTGLQNGIGNFAGLIGPVLTGFVVWETGSFLAAFAITVVILIVGFVSWVFVVGPLEEVNWGSRARRVPAALDAKAS
jgi:MFS transporter, ACS family, D-galactonate transporter